MEVKGVSKSDKFWMELSFKARDKMDGPALGDWLSHESLDFFLARKPKSNSMLFAKVRVIHFLTLDSEGYEAKFLSKCHRMSRCRKPQRSTRGYCLPARPRSWQ